jgi:3-deoxy-D-manno-octulosonic-acid transferase
MESEIWPALIHESYKRKIKVMIVNAKLSDSSYKLYKKLYPLIGWMFQKLSLILVQSPQDSRKYIDMKIDKNRIFMTGNMKFSALPNVKLERSAKLRSLLGYKDSHIVWVCGSTHPEEETLLTAIFQELKAELPQLRLILAPRHPERFGVVEDIINSAARLTPIRLSHIKESLLGYARYREDGTVSSNLIKLAEKGSTIESEKLSLDKVLYDVSQMSDMSTPNRTYSADDVLLIDTIGDLMDIYSIADIAFVGGTINETVGGHNVLEPAACRVPVIIGPHYYKNTAMVNMMDEADALIIAETKEDLRLAVLELALNPDKRILMGSEAKNLTDRNKRIVIDVAELLKKEIY